LVGQVDTALGIVVVVAGDGQEGQQQCSLHWVGQLRQGSLEGIDQPLVVVSARDRVPARLAQGRDRRGDQPGDVLGILFGEGLSMACTKTGSPSRGLPARYREVSNPISSG
jgi:hypothetical protein